MAFSVISAMDGSPALSEARSISYFMWEGSNRPWKQWNEVVSRSLRKKTSLYSRRIFPLLKSDLTLILHNSCELLDLRRHIENSASTMHRNRSAHTTWFWFRESSHCFANLIHVITTITKFSNLVGYHLPWFQPLILLHEKYLHEKYLQFDWLRAMVFQLNLKYLHAKITNLLWLVV